MPDDLSAVAARIVTDGEGALTGESLARFGLLVTADRREIESYRTIETRMREYCLRERETAPGVRAARLRQVIRHRTDRPIDSVRSHRSPQVQSVSARWPGRIARCLASAEVIKIHVPALFDDGSKQLLGRAANTPRAYFLLPRPGGEIDAVADYLARIRSDVQVDSWFHVEAGRIRATISCPRLQFLIVGRECAWALATS
ncbi:MAG: hypothetical protein ACRENP_11190 [Longimicrobiales bacterium]